MTLEREVVLTDTHSALKRVIFTAIGTAALVLPALDFWEVLFSVSVFTPLFWIIVIGGATVGAAFLGGAVLGDSTELRVTAGRITLARSNLIRESQRELMANDIREIRIRTHAWEDRPETYSVEVLLARGRPVGSSYFGKRAMAEALAERLKTALASA